MLDYFKRLIIKRNTLFLLFCSVLLLVFGASYKVLAAQEDTGTLSVHIEPAQVCADGATWSLDGGATWYESGEILLLETGNYTVDFSDLTGWDAPAEINVQVSKDEDIQCYAFYTPWYGDITRSGSVEVADAILILRHIVGLIDLAEEYDPAVMLRAGISGGTDDLSVKDAIFILQYIVGLIDEFPVASLYVEFPEGVWEDEFNYDDIKQKDQALQEAMWNESAGGTVIIPDYSSNSYNEETIIEETSDEEKIVTKRTFHDTDVTIIYYNDDETGGAQILDNAYLAGQAKPRGGGSSQGTRQATFGGASLYDIDGNRTRGTIIIRGNVVTAGDYSYDFGSPPSYLNASTFSEYAKKVWDEMPPEFDPVPPDCGANTKKIVNGRITRHNRSETTTYFHEDLYIEESYTLMFSHTWQWICPDGPLQRVYSVSFQYSKKIYGETESHEYQSASYHWYAP